MGYYLIINSNNWLITASESYIRPYSCLFVNLLSLVMVLISCWLLPGHTGGYLSPYSPGVLAGVVWLHLKGIYTSVCLLWGTTVVYSGNHKCTQITVFGPNLDWEFLRRSSADNKNAQSVIQYTHLSIQWQCKCSPFLIQDLIDIIDEAQLIPWTNK